MSSKKTKEKDNAKDKLFECCESFFEPDDLEELSDFAKMAKESDSELPQITTEEVELMAYRLIRTEVRRFDRETSDAELGNYVKGVVDMQAELFGSMHYPC